MKTKSLVQWTMLVAALALVPASVSAYTVSGEEDFTNFYQVKPVGDRSYDLMRPGQRTTTIPRRGRMLWESESTVNLPYRNSPYTIRWSGRSNVGDLELPGLTPWAALTPKSRVRRAFEMTRGFYGTYRDPELPNENRRVHNLSRTRYREALEDTRRHPSVLSGEQKLRRLQGIGR